MLGNEPKTDVHMLAHHQFFLGSDGHARCADVVANAGVLGVAGFAIIADLKAQVVPP